MKKDARMKRIRMDIEVDTTDQKFVLLLFLRKEDEPVLKDATIRLAMIEENLEPVTSDQFQTYCSLVLKNQPPLTGIVMFCNDVRGPSESGSFPGIPCLSKNGEVQVIQNWTRGSQGDEWDDGQQFLFVPTVSA